MKWNMAVVPMLMLALFAPGLPAVEAQDSSLEGGLCLGEPLIIQSEEQADPSALCQEGMVPGAALTLTSAGIVADVGEESWHAESSEDGWFIFKGIPDGSYTLTVERKGVQTATFDVEVSGYSEALAQVAPEDVEVPLTVSREGEPIKEATVVAQHQHTGARSEAAIKDGKGTLLLRAGMYTLSVSSSEGGTFLKAQFLDGSEQSIDVAGGSATLSGVVRDQDGNPVEGAQVDVWIHGGYAMPYDGARAEYCCESHNQQATTGKDGAFRFSLPPGDVSLNIHKVGYRGFNDWFSLADGEERTVDVEVLKFPDKTAKISGKVVDAKGNPLRYVSISIQNVEYGHYACSTMEAPGDSGGGSTEPGRPEPSAEPAGAPTASSIAPYPYGHCDILVRDDGTFEGEVMPGYSTIHVYHDHWRTCTETRNADGSGSRQCGPEYLNHVQTVDLAPESSTKLDITLRQRAPADAKVSGYVVDQATKKAIPGASVHFNSQESYSWGSATTDKDGSYAIKLRGGHHMVSVYVDGYFQWQGMVEVPSGSDTSFDIFLKAGRSQYGCCYAYAEDSAVTSESSGSTAPRPASAPAPGQPATAPAGDSASQGADYEDLGGGLGPYDPEARSALTDGPTSSPTQESPALPVALVLLALVALVRRKL